MGSSSRDALAVALAEGVQCLTSILVTLPGDASFAGLRVSCLTCKGYAIGLGRAVATAQETSLVNQCVGAELADLQESLQRLEASLSRGQYREAHSEVTVLERKLEALFDRVYPEPDGPGE